LLVLLLLLLLLLLLQGMRSSAESGVEGAACPLLLARLWAPCAALLILVRLA